MASWDVVRRPAVPSCRRTDGQRSPAEPPSRPPSRDVLVLFAIPRRSKRLAVAVDGLRKEWVHPLPRHELWSQSGDRERYPFMTDPADLIQIDPLIREVIEGEV